MLVPGETKMDIMCVNQVSIKLYKIHYQADCFDFKFMIMSLSGPSTPRQSCSISAGCLAPHSAKWQLSPIFFSSVLVPLPLLTVACGWPRFLLYRENWICHKNTSCPSTHPFTLYHNCLPNCCYKGFLSRQSLHLCPHIPSSHSRLLP